MTRLLLPILSVLLLWTCNGCWPGCTPSMEPGVMVSVVDAVTGETVANPTLTLTDGDYSETIRTDLPVYDSQAFAAYGGAIERPGLYTLTASAPGYETQIIRDILVLEGRCHPLRAEVEVKLQPAG